MAMTMSGEVALPADRMTVWTALNDPEVLKRCIPGCQELQKLSDTELQATVRAAVGPVKATFKGRVTLTDLDPPNAYRISGEAEGEPRRTPPADAAPPVRASRLPRIKSGVAPEHEESCIRPLEAKSMNAIPPRPFLPAPRQDWRGIRRRIRYTARTPRFNEARLPERTPWP